MNEPRAERRRSRGGRSGERGKGRGGRGRSAPEGAPKGGDSAKGRGRPGSPQGEKSRGDGERGKGHGRRRGRGKDPVAALTRTPRLDLEQTRDIPFTDAERKEAEGHLAFLKRFKTALRLSLNAKEDLLVNGARPPEDRGVLKHLFQKVDNAAVERAVAREPLKSDLAARAAFLGGLVRLSPDPQNLLAYLEALAAADDRRVAARAFGATVERIDFSLLSAAQLGRLLEVCRGTFEGPDRVQALFGLLDAPSFAKAAATHDAQLPDAVAEELRPLVAAHAAVTQGLGLPDDEAGRALVAEGVRRWAGAPAEVLKSYPIAQRARLAEFLVVAADGTAPDALPRALMDSIPRDHADYAQLGLAWSEKLTRAGQVDAAVGLLRQITAAHPDRRDAARRLRALEGERYGDLVLGKPGEGGFTSAFWLTEAAHGWLWRAPKGSTDEARTRMKWQADLALPGVAPVLASGRGPDGRAYLLLSASGAPARPQRRGLLEALRFARDALTILRGLAAVGVELPDGDLARFWGDGKRQPLTLVDLTGASKTDPARAAMGLAAPASELARAILWDERREDLRADLPEDLGRRLRGRAPITALLRALVVACAR